MASTRSNSVQEQDALLGERHTGSAYDSTELIKTMKGILAGAYDEDEVQDVLEGFFVHLQRTVEHSRIQNDKPERVLAVTVPRNPPLRLFCLTCITLGLYYLIRPRDDLAVLLLQKSGHVLMVREEDRSSWSWELKFALLLVLVNVLLPLGVSFYFLHHDEIDSGLAQDVVGKNTVHDVLDKTIGATYLMALACWLIFMFCMWQHRQRGYGARIGRRFKCAYICAAQYTLRDDRDYISWCCRRRSQMGSLRLFFGKYPPQTQLDSGQHLSSHHTEVLDGITTGAVSTTTEMSPACDSASKRRTCGRGSPLAAFLFFVMSGLLQLSIVLGYYQDVARIIAAQTFCNAVTRASNTPGHSGEIFCKPNLCRQYFRSSWLDLGMASPDLKFCWHVTWITNASHLCPITQQRSCCTMCTFGALYEYFGGNDPKEWIKSMETVATYLAALAALFTGAAVINYLSQRALTPQVDLDFQQDIYQPSEDAYLMKGELALDFLHHMFAMDGAEDVQTIEEDRESLWLLSRDEAPTWHSFFLAGRRLTDLTFEGFTCCASFPGKAQVCIPEHLLGLAPHEKLLKAWEEKTSLSDLDMLKAISVAVVLALGIVYAQDLLNFRFPSKHDMMNALEQDEAWLVTTTTVPLDASPLGRLDWYRHTLGEPALVCVLAALLTPVVLSVRFIELLKVQCCTIVTSHRVFSIIYRPNVLYICPFGWKLRMEVFRHDAALYYGRMRTTTPTVADRCIAREGWRPGEIVVQSIFGVLRMQRSRGDISEVYDMVATRLSADVKASDGVPPGNSIASAQEPRLYGVKQDSLTSSSVGHGASKVEIISWATVLPHDPRPRKAVPVKFKCNDDVGEQLLFVWSFHEEPRLSSPYVQFNDIVVTTDSIRLSSVRVYKPFDCQDCCFWCFPYYACVHALLGTRHLPEVQSFLNFTHLQAFSTEYTAEPPLCSVSCPCLKVLCNWLTRCALCRCCRRAAPRVRMHTVPEVRQPSGSYLACTVVEEDGDSVKVHYHDARLPDEWLDKDSDRLNTGVRLSDCCHRPQLAEPRTALWLLILPKYAQEMQPDLMLCLRPCHAGTREIADLADGEATQAVDLEEAVVLRALLNIVLNSQADKQREEDDDRGSVWTGGSREWFKWSSWGLGEQKSVSRPAVLSSRTETQSCCAGPRSKRV